MWYLYHKDCDFSCTGLVNFDETITIEDRSNEEVQITVFESAQYQLLFSQFCRMDATTLPSMHLSDAYKLYEWNIDLV
jgi:hypothetical protein